jgi:protease-4
MRTLPPLLASLLTLSAPLIAADGTTPATTKKDTPVIAVYDLEGQLSESGKGGGSLFDLDPKRPLTLFDLSKSLGRARGDEAVKAVVLDVDGAQLDFAQIQEIRSHLLAIRKAGKDVWLYTEGLTNGTALLGSAANHFTLMPEADCEFHGIYAESLYYKGLLDKVGIRADVIHIGDFKSFGESYYRTGPSDYAKQQQDKLIDSIFEQLVDNVASGRNLTGDQVRAIIDDGSLTATKAVRARLADHAMYRTDFVRQLRETYGKNAKFDRQYQLPDRDGPDIEGMMDIVKLMFQQSKSAKSTKDFVAVVTLEGDISDESVAPVRSQVLKLVKDDKAKALVLRVNSPGGSALASEVLWEAIDEWKQTKRPYVVSMGGVAASGGYYVACGADRIFAEPGTITGSIGVVGMKLVLGDAMNKVGITSHATQRGKNAGLSSMTRGYTPDEVRIIRKSMEEVYGTFKKRVADGRAQALKGDLESLAGGRVYAGRDALAIGLVDELGGLTEAIIQAKRMARGKLETRFLPEPKSMIEGMFAKPEKDDDEIIRAGQAPSPTPAAALRAALVGSGLLETLPPATRRSLSRLANRLEAFKNTRVLMLGPDLELNW